VQGVNLLLSLPLILKARDGKKLNKDDVILKLKLMLADLGVRDARPTNQSDKLVHRRMKHEAEENLRDLENS